MADIMTKNIKTFLQSLIAQEVFDFVISPGSRTTPVVILLAEIAKEDPRLHLYLDVDERSASFFALGIAKKRHQAVALICTSGTAATEYASAVAEAKLSQIPLIVITTDRPMELTNIGAPQAIEQHNLYGQNTKDFVEISLQADSKTIPEFIKFETQRIVIKATISPRAPVQINLPLRKPLMPELNTADVTVPVIQSIDSPEKIAPDFFQSLDNKKILIIAGPETNNYHQDLLELAQKKGLPIVSDILSNTRSDSKLIINNFDLVTKVLNKEQLNDFLPDVILRFGNTLVSAAVSNWLSKIKSEVSIVNICNNDLADYTLSTNRFLFGNESAIIKQMSQADFKVDGVFTKTMVNLNEYVETTKNKLLADFFTEMSIPGIIDDTIPNHANVFLSNSMPVRDFENYYRGKSVREIYCNRGANGIDGVVSTALGTAIHSSNNYLVIGDLALFHDMNGLMMARRYQINLNIIVINNNGGGIFSFLPQAQADEYFEKLFGTPQDLDLSKVASLYDFSYEPVRTASELSNSLEKKDPQKIIEVFSNREENVKNHQVLESKLKKELYNYVKINDK